MIHYFSNCCRIEGYTCIVHSQSANAVKFGTLCELHLHGWLIDQLNQFSTDKMQASEIGMKRHA